jgi:hypothetical protein
MHSALSSLLFIYEEKIFQLILEGYTMEIKVNSIFINNLQYANDMVILRISRSYKLP